MDKDVWVELRNAVRSAERTVPRSGRRGRYSDRLIVLMHFWNVAYDRPRYYACLRSSHTALFRPRAVPSYSQFCRRLQSPRVRRMIEAVNERLTRAKGPRRLAMIDGKEMPLRPRSRDRDAGRGRGHDGFYTGYKLHALMSRDGRILAHSVHPANVAEPKVARQELLPRVPSKTLILGDASYDSKHLYELARQRDSRFLAPIKRNPAITRSRTNNARRQAVLRWETRARSTRRIYRRRRVIEQGFSRLVCRGGGLGPLPTWVRGLKRTRLWTAAKIAIHHAVLRVQDRQRAP